MGEAVGVPIDGTAAGSRRAPAAAAGWDALLACAAGLLLASVARMHLVFPALAGLRPILVCGGAGLVLLLLANHPARRGSALAVPTAFCILGLLGWSVLGVPLAFRAGHSFLFIQDTLVKAILVALIVAGSVRDVRDVERLALVYFAGAAVYASVVLRRFDVGGEEWRLQALYTYDPNDFATFAVTAIPLGIHFLAMPGKARRAAAALGLLALSAAFVRSGSRGAFLALLLVAGWLVVRYRTVPAPRRVLAVGLVFGAIAVTAAAGFWERMGTLLEIEEDYNVTSATGRLEVWTRGLGYLWDRPVLGLGIDNFRAAEGELSAAADLARYGIGVPWTPPHNSFLQVATELGLPGLFLFLGIFWTLGRALAAVARAREGAPPADPAGSLAPVLIASLLGFAAGAFFLSLAYSDMLYGLVGLGVGLVKVAGRPR